MTDVANQTSPSEGIQPKNHVSATEQSQENQTGNELVLFPSRSNSCPTDIQGSVKHTTTTLNGDI